MNPEILLQIIHDLKAETLNLAKQARAEIAARDAKIEELEEQVAQNAGNG